MVYITLELMCPSCRAICWNRTEDERLFECDNCRKRCVISEMIVVGEFYVYKFVNDSWGGIPFYIGKGKNNRFKQMSGRNSHILNICKNTQWHPEIIKYCSSEKEALEQEVIIKNEYKNSGYPIIDNEIHKSNLLAQREGIEIAKKQGKFKGRKEINIDNDTFTKHYNRYKQREINKTEFAKILGVSRPTLNKLINQSYKEGV